MSDKLTTRVIQVTNIAPSCSKEQLRTLFGYLGRIKELEMYPPDGAEGVVTARVAYIEFEDSMTTGVALHLSSTVFIDRAIMIVPVMDGKIPDESSALQLTPSAVAGMLPGQPTWPANVVSQVTGLGANQIIMTNDPRLTSLGLPQYPPLPATTDPSKIEEIRRTVYISDLDAKVTPEMLLSFFSQTGEIKYIRMAGDENAPTRSAYIEFTDQRCIAQALSYNNVVFQGRTVSVKHATTSIVKPTPKSEASQREIDDAMKKVKEASKLISAAANSDRDSSRSPTRKRSRSKGRSRSRSRSRRRSRSRSPRRRRRSGSRTRRRSRSRRRSPKRSRSPVRRRRSRSRGRVPQPAPPVTRDSRRRSRTRSPVRRRRSRSRSKSKPRRSRTPPKSYSRGRRSHSRSRRSRSRDRREKRERKKSRSMSPPTLIREGSASVEEDRDKSPTKGNGRSPSPPRAKKRSPTPKRRSRSRSPTRRKRRRHSPSPSRKRSRSRSGSRHRSRRDRKRSRSRDRKHDSKKKTSRDKEDRKKESSSKIKRDYDEEEKGFASDRSEERDNSEGVGSRAESPSQPPLLEKDTDNQPVDMDMSD